MDLVKSQVSQRVGILTGPTGTGKSDLAFEFALRNPQIELINADSLLVYRGMDIGTAKPSCLQLSQVTHHLIDILNPDQTFTAGDFYRMAKNALEDIHRRGKRGLIVGGTGFYIKALLFGLWTTPPTLPFLRDQLEELSNQTLYENLEKIDPSSAKRIGTTDRYRLVRALELCKLTGKTLTELQSTHSKTANEQFFVYVMDRPDSELSERIKNRTDQMLNSGLIDEVKKLLASYPGSRALSSVGYIQARRYLQGEVPSGRKVKPGLHGLSEEIELATRQLVKKQRTWFKGQKHRVPHMRYFELERDRGLLVEALNSVYD